MTIAGRPSDEVPAILATGRSGIGTLFVSMAARHPHGGDADYLAWHSLDHRPEQHRLPGLRATLRLVSTPECRTARAVGDAELDAVDHVMTYFFADQTSLGGFTDLSVALRNADRTPFVLPPVTRGIYDVRSTAADPSIRTGADVLPWWPASGVYLVLEVGSAPTVDLIAEPGVAGVWSAVDDRDHQITYCFLDDDPVATGEHLRPIIEERARVSGVRTLLAAPFHLVVPREWNRYVPWPRNLKGGS